MDKPEMNKPLERTPRENEIFLSFTHDGEAEMFADWWETKGFIAFQEYMYRNMSGELYYNDETVVDPDPITEG